MRSFELQRVGAGQYTSHESTGELLSMPLITIPRTDASPSRWPEGYLDYEADITKNENYHEKITT